MKHYRILEKKGEKKQYIIQYLKKLFFGLFYWKKVNDTIYFKYEEAFNETKQLIEQSDYDGLEFGYHYIDAYKIFKTPTKIATAPPTIQPQPRITTPAPAPTPTPAPTVVPVVSNIQTETKISKSKAVFVPRTEYRKTNKSVFIPKNK